MGIIRRSEELKKALLEKRFGGPGVIDVTRVINSDEELYGRGRLFNENVLV